MRSKFKWIFTLLLAFSMQFSFAQEKTVSGVITEGGLPLPQVNVQVKGTNRGVQTDMDGKYAIKAKAGEVLEFSYLSMKTQSVTVGASNAVNIAMVASAEELENVVVVAYGKQDKKTMVQSVAIVGLDQIKDIPAISPQELLQGQAAGVQVVGSSGILGSAPVIKIRGVASISAGGSPLIVVDGVPLNDRDMTDNQGGNQGLNPLADINPADIQSFSVLKDAAATAVYGSRGANGVILITTKSGKRGQKTSVSLNVSTSISEKTDTMDILSAAQFKQYLIDRGSAPSTSTTSYDWIKGVTRTGISKDVDFSVSGGEEKTTFYLGANFKDQQGFIRGNNLRKNGVRLNLTHQATDWLKVGANMAASETKIDRVGAENNTAAPMTTAYLQSPLGSPYDAQGRYQRLGLPNVVAIEDLDINFANTFRVYGNVFAEAQLFDGLTYKADFGVDRIQLEQFQRQMELNTEGGYGYNDVSQQNKYVFTNTLNFNRRFNDVHEFNAVAGISYEKIDVRSITVEGTGFLSDALINVTSAAQKTTTSNATSASSLVGYFTRAGYVYDGKYSVEGSFRRDGSSRFGANNKFGNFWSVGAAWVVSREEFLVNSTWLSNLKLKGSYGTAGNDRIGDYGHYSNFTGGILGAYADNGGQVFATPANPDLQWEKSKSYDLGFELGMFNNRVKLEVDYYNKKTEDMLLFVPIQSTNGGLNGYTKNAGSMENKGFDITLSTVNVKTDNFEWSSSINFGINKNKVLDLPGASQDLDGNRYVSGGNYQRAIEGHSVNSFFLIRYNGINPQTGNAEWLDKNGNVTLTPTANDRVIVGDANPDFVGGFTNTVKWGNFDLNVLINFSYGNDIYVEGLQFTDVVGGGFNKRVQMLNYWKQPGDNAHAPSMTSPTRSTFNQASTAQLKDGSYARLKNLTLGYTLPKDIVNRFGFVQGVRLYFTAVNLYTLKSDELKGIDPEVSSRTSNLGQGETFFSAPQSKTFLFGARLTF
ncbi:SusC/RagA family TonB-linked outer membrane protein [Flavobacterium sp. '19STA2R22 D10 B1']|uniref:SusC/RagA family TonB-linked outer membrane protein n=1 Tax=Flavobacterium aerium TaxID=3037261 RepID=UPI00278C4019|nr:TonB-dependent receptor [Flavobacterium sp. '19STA2R22 D10 B1']